MSKITKEELKKLQESHNKFNAIKHDIGVMETQKYGLLLMFSEEAKLQEEMKKELEKNYGKVNIDLKDGSYELIPEKNEEN